MKTVGILFVGCNSLINIFNDKENVTQNFSSFKKFVISALYYIENQVTNLNVPRSSTI